MAKTSTTIMKVDTQKVEFKSEGTLRVNDNGQLLVETPDYGNLDLLTYMKDLGLLNETVKVVITLTDEDKEEVDPLTIG